MIKHPSKILLSPRVTEKGAHLSERDCYVFNVSPFANKREISNAVREIFKVKPRLVRIARVARKKVHARGNKKGGMTAGGKKAYAYLKKGDKIEII